MTIPEIAISAAITGAVGLVVWVVKDKQKSDLDYFKDLVKALKEDISELREMLKAEEADRKATTKEKDDCLKKVHEMEIEDQKKSNEITLLRLKTNAKNDTNNY